MPAIDERLCITCSAPNNIATIKYWGKENVGLNTPINSSVSVTLNQDDLKAITTIAASKDYDCDRIWLNGKEESVESNSRLKTVLQLIRNLAQTKIDPVTAEIIVRKEEWPQYKVHISSRNTFPTAAGLASSAAGYACLTYALAKLYSAEETYNGEFTAIARQGSGSACRSMFGGYVRWQKGHKSDGSDSIAIQIADENHWPELRALILVASSSKKGTSSTAGMDTSVKTSKLLGYRAAELVVGALKANEEAYLKRDFEKFGETTMRDSSQFHAVCMDTYPPIFYLNDVSRNIIQAIHAYNEFYGRVLAAYTFDAGPNAVIFTLQDRVAEVLALLATVFPLPADVPTCTDPHLAEAAESHHLSEDLLQKVKLSVSEQSAGSVKIIYATKAGDGPRVLGPEHRMIDLQTGLNSYVPRA